MNIISPLEIFIALFIGMGPVKVLLIYIATTENMEKSIRRQVARRTAMIAGIVALGLFLLGAILQAILHFSIGSLTIFGGLILLILALGMVTGGGGASPREHGDDDPMSLAVSPLAIPLTLNPVGIVILVVASVEVQDLMAGLLIIGMIVVIALIDLSVLYSADRVAKYLSHATIELLERVLGILLGALAIELIVVGLSTLGIIGSTAH
ncbi:MAG: MarC family protein [Chloroflexota bacterium]|nr:MAG: MarC family protein [Chloroflexota bacterium]